MPNFGVEIHTCPTCTYANDGLHWFRCANGLVICTNCGEKIPQPPDPREARMREIAIDEAERAVRNNEAQKDFLLREERARTKYRGHPIRYCETCNDWHLCSAFDKPGNKR